MGSFDGISVLCLIASMILFSAFLLSLLITILLTPMFSTLAVKVHAVDLPDARKVHARPIPRSGGIPMALGVLFPTMFFLPGSLLKTAYLLGSGIIILFGVVDDLNGLGHKAKFAAQTVAALVVIYMGDIRVNTLGNILPEGWVLPVWMAVTLTLILIVGITNAINLADGLDGLAGGISLLGFCCIAYLANLEGQIPLTLVAVCLTGAIFGFLRFNTYPAKIFMGDTGSQFLGFSAVILSVALTQSDETALSPLLPLVLLGFPVLDTVAVMAQRLTEGRSVFSADKNHFHHRLLVLGFQHKEAVLIIYVIQVLLVMAAILLRYHSEQLLLAGYILISALIVSVFYVADKTGWRLQRFDFLDREVKGRLRVVSGHRYRIRVSFRSIEFGLPLLVLISSLIPATLPFYLAVSSVVAGVSLILMWYVRKNWMPYLLLLVLYLFTPFLVFLSTEHFQRQATSNVEIVYNVAFVVIAFFVIVTLKFTSRERGFRIKPTDFLILSIILAAPFLIGDYIEKRALFSIASKTVVFFFSFEVLVGELRGECGRLTIFTIISLVVIAARGITG